MKIYINSRLYTKKHSGIQNYIKMLASGLLKFDKNNEYIFRQVDPSPSIGYTETINTYFGGKFGEILFDAFFSQKGVHAGIFHAPSFILPFYKRKNVKYVVTVHDLSFLIFPTNHSHLFNTYYYFFLKRTLYNADKIIAISENTKSDILRFFKGVENKIEVVYLASDSKLELLYHDAKDIIGQKYFFSLTTHTKRKNINSVIHALAQSQILQDYIYVIVGIIGNDQKSELESLIDGLGMKDKVRILGYVSSQELVSLYKYAECFVYPSFYEGFGIPVLDSLRLHCPVVTSNNSSLPEITPPHYPYLVDPYSVTDIINKIENVIKLSTAERKYLIENNFLYSQKFSLEAMTTSMLHIYSSLR